MMHQTVNTIPPYLRWMIYAFSALLFSYFAGFSMLDDGMRHIAFAAHPEIMESWADVFPHSLFFREYDPWHVWHSIIALYLEFIPYHSVHTAITATVLFLMMLLIDQLLIKYSDMRLGSVHILLVLAIVILGDDRYITVRPDLLSGLYVMAALLFKERGILLFILTLFYAPSYYLFFLYTGSIGLVYLTLKDAKAFSAVFIASLLGLALHLSLDGTAYLQTVWNLLTDQSLRSGLEVGEGKALFGFLSLFNYYALVLFFGGIITVITYKFYAYFQKQPLALFLLITSILWIIQVRYFLLLRSLMLLYLLIEFRNISNMLLSRRVLYYLFRMWHIIRSASSRPLFYLLAIPYTIAMFAYSMQTNETRSKELLQTKGFFSNKKLDNRRFLSNSFNLNTYFALYLNPTLEMIPSCSIGWFEQKSASMKEIYIRMMKPEGIKEEELQQLLAYTRPDYYLHSFRNIQQVLDFKRLKAIGLEPLLILDNQALFKYTMKDRNSIMEKN